MSRWSEFTRAANAQILEWAQAQPWAREIAVCQQDTHGAAAGKTGASHHHGMSRSDDGWILNAMTLAPSSAPDVGSRLTVRRGLTRPAKVKRLFAENV